MNYFQIFNLPTEFEINLDVLEAKYLELQKTLHPDSRVDSSDISQIVDINEAYRVLKNDYLRGSVLLKYNFDIDLSDDYIAKKYVNSNFLSEIMMEMEALEEENNIDSLERVKKQVMIKKANLIEEISTAFGKNDKETIAQKIVYLKYYENLIQTINMQIEKCY